MELTEALANKKKEILTLWIERTLDSYASPGFFKSSKDPFANPVGSNISAGLTALFELLVAKAEHSGIREPLRSGGPDSSGPGFYTVAGLGPLP